jgi:hypothetical protein
MPSPTKTHSTSFAMHEMVKTDIKSSKFFRSPAAPESTKVRAQSDADPNPVQAGTDRDKFRKPFPVKASSDRDLPKYLPPTPPSETESYSLQRSRSQSQPSVMRSLTARSSGESSDYNPPQRNRLIMVRDENNRGGTEIRRAKSVGGRGRNGDNERRMNRSFSKREYRSRKDDGDDIYDLYNDYYEEKPITRSLTTRRPLGRSMSRSRTSSSSRGRSREDEEELYSDGEDDEFEMITPKRTEISKVFPDFSES